MTKNKAAQTLGRMARGKPKHYSNAELARRTKRLIAGRRAYAKEQRQARARK